jgi:methionyl-tRNA synthetase
VDSFFISTPIYYVNAKPHLGHAYTTIIADSVNRFHRLMGRDCYFLTGTDEHGDKIVQAAEANGQSPQEYVDRISGLFRDLWPDLQIENTRFVRTTDEEHKKCVQAFLQRVHDRGDIYFAEYGGYYCFGCERFYTEKELQDGLCPDHLTKPEYIQEKNYFFRMSKYLEPLREYIEENPDFIQPEQYRNEVLGLLREDLGDLCISRPKSRLTWGIELPFDKEFVTYVWFDALLNYISVLGWPDGEQYQRYWPNSHHLVAKDILKPHAVFWPTMLMAAGLPLYKGLRVHGYWTVNETKMSKSLGNVVAPLSMAEKYGLNAFRYFLLREMRFGSDSSFSEEALVNRFNSDLANDLGNLFSRTLSMTGKYFKGQVPEPGPFTEEDREVMDRGLESLANFQQLYGGFRFSRALDGVWDLIRSLNKYIDTMAPWVLAKEGRTERLGTVMYVILEGMRKVALHVWPIIPGAAEEMLAQLGQPFEAEKVALAGELTGWNGLQPGVKVSARSNVFPRQELKLEQETPAKETAVAEPEADLIEFPDFQKVDLRVGTVVSAGPVPKADRLLLLKVDVGEAEPRQIVAGLAEFWTPEKLTGMQVVVVANLKPRKLRGHLSQGMVLAVRTEEGLELLNPTGPVSAGAKVS